VLQDRQPVIHQPPLLVFDHQVSFLTGEPEM